MLASTFIPVRHCHIPARAQVVSVFATAHNPYTGKPARVVVLAVRLAGSLANPVKVADVRQIGALLPFSVPVAEVKNVSAFCVQEVE